MISKSLFLVGLLIIPGCEKQHEIPVKMYSQETSAWCWAASGEMIMEFLGRRVRQCVQANNALGRNDCSCSQCTGSKEGDACEEGGWPEFFRYGFDYKRTSNQALSWEQLKREISGDRPVAFSWHLAEGGGHMMVAVGFFVRDGQRYVEVIDPASSIGRCQGSAFSLAYEDYVEGEGYSHWDDFYDIHRR